MVVVKRDLLTIQRCTVVFGNDASDAVLKKVVAKPADKVDVNRHDRDASCHARWNETRFIRGS